MNETLQGIGLFTVSFFGVGFGSLFFGLLMSDFGDYDTEMFGGAWITSVVIYAITMVVMFK